MINVGIFTIEVSEGYPVFVTIKIGDRKLAHISHADVPDLKYALERAQVETMAKLGKKHAHEVCPSISSLIAAFHGERDE